MLRIGVLLPPGPPRRWQARCLQELRQREAVCLTRLPPIGRRARQGYRRILWNLYWNHWVQRRAQAYHPDALTLPHYEGDDLDMVLDLTGGTDPAYQFNALHGTWSFLLGNPPCFWTLFRRAPTISVSLVTTHPGPGRRVLRQGEFRLLPFSYTRTLDSCLLGLAEWIAGACHDVRTGNDFAGAGAPAQAAGPYEGAPTNRQTATFLLRQAIALGRSAGQYLLRAEQWSIGVIHQPASTLLDPGTRPTIQWLPEPGSGRFLADPFALPAEDGSLTILAEEFNYRTFRGRIASVNLQVGQRPTPPKPALDVRGHAAYPFLFQYQDVIYCVPDTGLSRELALYRAVHFPQDWERVASILSDIQAVDATIFPHGDYWWLLYSDGETGPYGTLYGLYASSPLGPWTPHPANPLKMDVRSSRPAGTPFVHHGQLYRPAQNCSHTYGGAVAINRVTCLTPDRFHEETVATLRPDPLGPYPAGLHTLCAVGNVTLVDGRRDVFSLRTLVAQSGQLLAHLHRE